MAGEREDVLGALAQRRDGDREDVDPIVEVVAELSFGNEVGEVAVGGGEEMMVSVNELQ